MTSTVEIRDAFHRGPGSEFPLAVDALHVLSVGVKHPSGAIVMAKRWNVSERRTFGGWLPNPRAFPVWMYYLDGERVHVLPELGADEWLCVTYEVKR